MVTLLNISSKILIREIDDIMSGIDIRTSKKFDDIARFVLNRRITTRSTHLWPLGINQNTNVRTYFAHVPYYILYTLR